MPRVSVIMPVYNGERYVRQAVESVTAQSFADWELVAVNDGSSDATQSILEGFSDERIVVVQQENRGPAAARNTGFDYACGDYIAFLDADDLYLPNAFADCVEHLESHTMADAVFADGDLVDACLRPVSTISDIRPGIYTGHILDHILLDPHVISFPVCTMTRRRVIVRHGLRFDPQLRIGEDWDFWIRLARYAQFHYLPKKICLYRIHQENLTKVTRPGRRRSDLVQGRLKVLEADWFSDLAPTTKHKFFYHLLIGLLSGKPEPQNSVLESPAFIALPHSERAELLRMLASEYLRLGQETDFARECLARSLAICPRDRRARALYALSRSRPAAGRLVLRAWRHVRTAVRRVRAVGHPSDRRPSSAQIGLEI